MAEEFSLIQVWKYLKTNSDRMLLEQSTNERSKYLDRKTMLHVCYEV